MEKVNLEKLAVFERQLDLMKPEGGPFGCKIVGYGELTVVMTLEALPGNVYKRISGFLSESEARSYAEAICRYLRLLDERGITTAPTSANVVGGTPVVYLIQPLLNANRLGHSLLHTASERELHVILAQVLDTLSSLLKRNRQIDDGIEVAADAQLSNWYFPEEGGSPCLLDVGSPIFRINGRMETYSGNIYRALPQPIRWAVKKLQMVEDYFLHYFDMKGLVFDILGNMIKENAENRLPEGLACINSWLQSRPEWSDIGPITEKAVRRFYWFDAVTLELLLRVRRYNRFIHNRILKKRYDYILPGKIAR